MVGTTRAAKNNRHDGLWPGVLHFRTSRQPVVYCSSSSQQTSRSFCCAPRLWQLHHATSGEVNGRTTACIQVDGRRLGQRVVAVLPLDRVAFIIIIVPINGLLFYFLLL